MTRIAFILFIVFQWTLAPIAAQVFQKGADAARAGDYATTLKEWTALAKAGMALTGQYSGSHSPLRRHPSVI